MAKDNFKVHFINNYENVAMISLLHVFMKMTVRVIVHCIITAAIALSAGLISRISDQNPDISNLT